jgi:basic membrane protein A and related proteins
MRAKWLRGALALGLVAAACGGGEDTAAPTQGATTAPPATTPAETVRVAFVYDGTTDDGGWNQQHDLGRQYLLEQLPGVETTIVEEIAPGQQAQSTFDDLASQGYDLIIGTTFYQPDVLAIAEDYPDVRFLTWAGFETAPNVGHFDAATEEGRYLDGLIAGAVTKVNEIGYSAGFPIEEVVRGINAFTIGAREVNPEAEVRAVWINSWFDPPKESQAATALADTGVDILAHELNSPATASVAERRGLYLIGYGADASSTAPNAWLGSFVFNWGPYYVSQVQAILDGTWEPSIFYGGLKDGMIDLAPFGEDVPPDTLELVEQRKQEIIDGTFDYFAGPLVDNKGNVVVPEGGTIPWEERTTCCKWLIEGVEGTIPAG